MEKFIKLKNYIIQLILNYKFLFFIYIIAAIITSIQKYIQTNGTLVYLIYRNAALQIHPFIDIYQRFPNIKDIFLYSPTFAVFFKLFAYLPVLAGCILWNILSICLFLIGVHLLKINNWKKCAICGIIFFEVLKNFQHYQANIFASAFIILTFCAFERKKIRCAAFCVGAGFFIKIFGLAFGILFLFYKRKIKFLSYLILTIIVLFLIPLFFISFDISYFIFLYKKWFVAFTAKPHANLSHYYTVYSVLDSWFNFGIYKGKSLFYLLQIASLIALVLPLLRFSKYKSSSFRLLFLGSMLIWVTIFNSRAESATYVIAMTGVAIWFISLKPTRLTIVILILAIIFTSLTTTDLFPPYVRGHFCRPFKIQAFPCIFIWILSQFQLLFLPFKEDSEIDT
jgi:hypothetical protein